MHKILECGLVAPGCKIILHGDTEEELMMKEMEHIRSVHEVDHVNEQLKARIRAAIREEVG